MLSAAITLVTVIFAIGGAWRVAEWKVKRLQTDLNGVGRVARDVAKKNDDRYLALCLVIVQFVPERDRAAAAAMLMKGQG